MQWVKGIVHSILASASSTIPIHVSSFYSFQISTNLHYPPVSIHTPTYIYLYLSYIYSLHLCLSLLSRLGGGHPSALTTLYLTPAPLPSIPTSIFLSLGSPRREWYRFRQPIRSKRPFSVNLCRDRTVHPSVCFCYFCLPLLASAINIFSYITLPLFISHSFRPFLIDALI